MIDTDQATAVAQGGYPPLGESCAALVVDATMAIADEQLRRSGAGLSPTDRASVAADVRRLLASTEVLRRYPLTNDNQPAYIPDFG